MSESTGSNNNGSNEKGGFKDLLRQLLAEGWTQADIATQLGVHRSTVNAWLKRDSVPAPYRASFISDSFGFREERVRKAIKRSRRD